MDSNGVLLVVVPALTGWGMCTVTTASAFLNTSMWAAKVLAPPDILEKMGVIATKQFLKEKRASLMKGWINILVMFSGFSFFASVIMGFIYSWKCGVIVLVIYILFVSLMNTLEAKHVTISYYLTVMLNKLTQRTAYYEKHNYKTSYATAMNTCAELMELIAIYKDSKVRSPKPKEVRANPYGDKEWLKNNQGVQIKDLRIFDSPESNPYQMPRKEKDNGY